MLRMTPVRGQVLENLKGGNRGVCPGGPMALRCYGELGGRACDDGSAPPCASIGGGCIAPGTAALSACWLATSRAAEHGDAAWGDGKPCRLWAMKSRRVAGTWQTI